MKPTGYGCFLPDLTRFPASPSQRTSCLQSGSGPTKPNWPFYQASAPCKAHSR